MLKNSTVHVRINSELKTNAEQILKQLGISTAEAIRIFYKQIELKKGIPFDVRVPNELTAETLTKSKQGEDVFQVKDIKQLFSELEI